MTKITKIKKEKRHGVYLTLGVLTAVFSIVGALGLSIAWADWPYPGSDPEVGDFPPGPVWLQVITGEESYEYQNGDIRINKAGFGGNNPDGSYKLSSPDAVFKDGDSGTTIRDGVITNDQDLKLKGKLGVGETGDSFGTSGQVLSSTGSGLNWVNVSSLPGSLPAGGTTGQTLRHNGTAWVANSNLYNDGTNVGIGTSSPTEKLDVAGSINAATSGAFLYSNNKEAIWYNSNYFSWGYEGDYNYFAKPIRIGGAGSPAPTDKLEVVGKTKTTNFQMTSGAALNKILTSDASGNATWQAFSFAGLLTDGTLTGNGTSGSPLSVVDGYVNSGGDTMTGNLILVGDPTADLGAVTKQYVDDNFQLRISGVCAEGSAIRGIMADGTVICETDDVGIGEAVVVTESPIAGNGTSGDPISLTTCGTGEVLKYTGSAWECDVDEAGVSELTVNTADPIIGTGTTSSPIRLGA
jgi:hypothetical protein